MQRRIAQPELHDPSADQHDDRMRKQSDFRHGGSHGPAGGDKESNPGGSLREFGGVGFLLRHAAEFNLSDAQQASLRKLRMAFELEKVDKLAAMEKAKITFRTLVRDPEAPERDVFDAIDRLAACEADLRKMRVHHLKAARAQLSRDQVAGVYERATTAGLVGGMRD